MTCVASFPRHPITTSTGSVMKLKLLHNYHPCIFCEHFLLNDTSKLLDGWFVISFLPTDARYIQHPLLLLLCQLTQLVKLGRIYFQRKNLVNECLIFDRGQQQTKIWAIDDRVRAQRLLGFLFTGRSEATSTSISCETCK